MRFYKVTLAAALLAFSAVASAQILNPAFIQEATAAVPRTFLSKARDVVSVKDFGAKGDGVTNDTAAIQAAIDYVGGAGGLGSTTGRHGRLFFPAGVYKTTKQLAVPGSTWITIEGESAHGTYIYQQAGSGAALQVQGSFYMNQGAVRKSSENDAGVVIRDISIGSMVGHSLSFLNAYNSNVSNVALFSAGTTSNYLDLDGVAVFNGEDIRTAGNDLFPAEWAKTLLAGRTRGEYGIYITSRVDGGGRYNVSGEIILNRPKVQAQQTKDGIYIITPSGADFQIYPVTINDSDIVTHTGYSNIKVNRAIAIINGGYGETVGGDDTVDAIEVLTTQGNTTVYVNNHIAPTCSLNLNGNGVNKPSLIATGGYYKTWRSASATYGALVIRNVMFVSTTTSALANYTTGDFTDIQGNFLDTHASLDKGAWTPGLTGWTNAGTPTTTGTWLKHGNLIFVTATITPATNINTNGGYINNLPFQSTVASGLVSVFNRATGAAIGMGSIGNGSVQLYMPNTGTLTQAIEITAQYRINN